MDYSYIEKLVAKAKSGDEYAKEMLAEEFKPMIINLSRKAYIHSYEAEDIKNECYRILFKCISLYNPDRHRFVAYASNGIRNSINHLIRASLRRKSTEGSEAFILDGVLENTFLSDNEHIDEVVLGKLSREKLIAALKGLTSGEKEMLSFVYFKGNSLRKYSELKGIPYSTASSRRAVLLNKLKGELKVFN